VITKNDRIVSSNKLCDQELQSDKFKCFKNDVRSIKQLTCDNEMEKF